MVNYTCAFRQSESGKYFEWIIMMIIILVKSCETLGASRYLKVFLFFCRCLKSPFILQTFYKEPKQSCPKMTCYWWCFCLLILLYRQKAQLSTLITTAISVHSLSGTEMSLHQDTTLHSRRQRFGESNGQLKGRSMPRARVKIIILRLEQAACTRICSVLPGMHI